MYQASSASVFLPVSPGDTLEVSHTLVLPHSFPDKTCCCRPGKRANAWPRAREPLPACWDLRKVCVSNPGSARWGRRGCWEGYRQGHSSPGAGKKWPPTPGIQVPGRPSSWALPSPPDRDRRGDSPAWYGRGSRPSRRRDWIPCAGAVLSLAQTHRGRPQTTSTRLYAGGELQGPQTQPPVVGS